MAVYAIGRSTSGTTHPFGLGLLPRGTQDLQGAGTGLDGVAGVLGEGVGGGDRGVVAVQIHEPGLCRLADRRDGEGERLPVGVDQDEEVVVEQRRAVVGLVWRVAAVQV